MDYLVDGWAGRIALSRRCRSLDHLSTGEESAFSEVIEVGWNGREEMERRVARRGYWTYLSKVGHRSGRQEKVSGVGRAQEENGAVYTPLRRRLDSNLESSKSSGET